MTRERILLSIAIFLVVAGVLTIFLFAAPQYSRGQRVLGLASGVASGIAVVAAMVTIVQIARRGGREISKDEKDPLR